MKSILYSRIFKNRPGVRSNLEYAWNAASNTNQKLLDNQYYHSYNRIMLLYYYLGQLNKSRAYIFQNMHDFYPKAKKPIIDTLLESGIEVHRYINWHTHSVIEINNSDIKLCKLLLNGRYYGIVDSEKWLKEMKQTRLIPELEDIA